MEKDIPTKYRKLYNKRKTSRKAAIRMFCIECTGYSDKEVKDCTDVDCPLFSWREKG